MAIPAVILNDGTTDVTLNPIMRKKSSVVYESSRDGSTDLRKEYEVKSQRFASDVHLIEGTLVDPVIRTIDGVERAVSFNKGSVSLHVSPDATNAEITATLSQMKDAVDKQLEALATTRAGIL